MTRAEHLAWAKQRAFEYVDAGDLPNAVASMTSDLSKHEETAFFVAELGMLGMMAAGQRDRDAVRRWIEGFN